MAESLWEPDLPAEDLFETISQTLLNAVDRDAYSGWGAVVWIIEKACSSPSINLSHVYWDSIANHSVPPTGQGYETMAQGSYGLVSSIMLLSRIPLSA